MRADAGLHAAPTHRQIGESGFHLATRPLLPQHDGTALILANDVERVFADIDTDYGGRKVKSLWYSGLLVFCRPPRLRCWWGGGAPGPSPFLPTPAGRAQRGTNTSPCGGPCPPPHPS